MTALDDLISAVEAGAISTDLIQDVFGNGWDDVLALAAFDGSLNAAKSLHDALLPGWMWGTQGTIFMFVVPEKKPGKPNRIIGTAKDGNFGRAWLLAILRAKRAMWE